MGHEAGVTSCSLQPLSSSLPALRGLEHGCLLLLLELLLSLRLSSGLPLFISLLLGLLLRVSCLRRTLGLLHAFLCIPYVAHKLLVHAPRRWLPRPRGLLDSIPVRLAVLVVICVILRLRHSS